MYKILIVDDESIEREGIVYLIDRYHLPLEVAQATNGRAALDYMREHPIDILLTDIKMPQMDGLTLAQHTFEIYPDVRILIFSAYGEFSFAKRAMAAHAVSYLLKPIEVDEFERIMREILAQCDELAATRRIALQRDEEDRQQQLFRLVTGSLQGRTESTPDLYTGETLCLVHVQSESNYFATHEETFCALADAHLAVPYDYINVDPGESYLLLHGSADELQGIADRVTALRDALREQNDVASFLVGETFTGAARILQRAQALERIRSELYEAPDAVISEQEVSDSISYYAESIEKRRAEVQLALKERRMEQVLPAAERLLQQMEQNRTLSRMYLYHVLYDLLFQVYNAYGVNDYDRISGGINRLLNGGNAAAMCNVLEQIMADLQGAPGPRAADSSAIIRQVRQIVESEYGEPVSLEYLAARVYITPSYLSYIFKQATGQNLLKYITDLRMDRARSMMSDASLKISQIARNCGYDNPSYFNKLFKNYYGITPRQYREGVRGEGAI